MNNRVIVIATFIFLCLLNVGCKSINDSKELLSYKTVNEDDLLVYDCFMVIPAYYCSSCIEDFLFKINQERLTDKFLFIIVGRNQKEINNFKNDFENFHYSQEVRSKIDMYLPILYLKENNKVVKKEFKNNWDLNNVLNLLK